MHGLTLIAILCLSGGLWVGARAGCCAGWTKFGDRCYQYVSTSADFATAEATCISKGGNLVTVRTKAELDQIREYLRSLTGKDTKIWTGGHDGVKEGVWMWTDGSKFGSPPWAPGQPDNWKNNEHCMELNFRRALNDFPCHVKRTYICSMTPYGRRP
ncbi:galactose-specific lectin nattectin-like [Synchiropus picturatus]